MLFIECKPDKTLALSLTGLPGKEIIHQLKGKYEVLENLTTRSNCIAMVDEDPNTNQPRYLERMELHEDYPELGLQLKLDHSRANRVAILRPRLEEWLVQAAHDVDIKLGDSRYNLPDDAKELKKVINRDLRKLERLFDDLLTAESPRILKLQQLLTN